MNSLSILNLLLVVFLVLWIVLGVGAVLLLVRFHKLISKVENGILDFITSISKVSNIVDSVMSKKEALVGGIALLTFLKRIFESHSPKKHNKKAT